MVSPLYSKFRTAEKLHPTEPLLIRPPSPHPFLAVNGVVWLGKIALFRICVEYEGDRDTHTDMHAQTGLVSYPHILWQSQFVPVL